MRVTDEGNQDFMVFPLIFFFFVHKYILNKKKTKRDGESIERKISAFCGMEKIENIFILKIKFYI